ncbi:MAG: hypothetical protein IJQ14_07410 [Bacteroidales bacterium]|nr:hypothetical protein [Bacteroidales bacterium]
MKKRYIKPIVEIYCYSPERGYALTIGSSDPIDNGDPQQGRDYVIVEGSDRRSLRGEEVTEFTDANGEYTTGLWE